MSLNDNHVIAQRETIIEALCSSLHHRLPIHHNRLHNSLFLHTSLNTPSPPTLSISRHYNSQIPLLHLKAAAYTFPNYPIASNAHSYNETSQHTISEISHIPHQSNATSPLHFAHTHHAHIHPPLHNMSSF